VLFPQVSGTQVAVQGSLCDEYFRVRQLLYGMFEVV
jgi:hypothetical protein